MVFVGVIEGVRVRVGVFVEVFVLVGFSVFVSVGVVAPGVGVAVRAGFNVGVAVTAAGVRVGVFVRIGFNVLVTVGVAVGVPGVGVFVDVTGGPTQKLVGPRMPARSRSSTVPRAPVSRPPPKVPTLERKVFAVVSGQL